MNFDKMTHSEMNKRQVTDEQAALDAIKKSHAEGRARVVVRQLVNSRFADVAGIKYLTSQR